jgi:tetratricopeptide (TPR) repeat protein
MREAYAASDVGLFPNRCEGGNNMVMCEYMACGRTVIASTMTGHMDVITSKNAFCLAHYEPVIALHDGCPAGVWFEASIDEIVAHLEQAYFDRAALASRGVESGRTMKSLSWKEAASKFHKLAQQIVECRCSSEAAVAVTCSQQHSASELFLCGSYEKAEQAYRDLIRKTPLDADLYNNLGTVLDRLERYVEAALCYEKALALNPKFIEARFNLANTLKRMGDCLGAIDHLKSVTDMSPRFSEAWQNMALCRLDNKDLAGSAAALEQVLHINPTCVKSRADLGEVLIELGRYEDAIASFDVVLASDPYNAGVLNSKGIALQWLNRLEEAEQCYRKIIEGDPENTLALNNLGAIMRSKALPDEAIVFFDRALMSAPDDGQILFNRSLALLSVGDFARGWPDYENRFKSNPPVHQRFNNLPRWKGEVLDGKSILLWCEQGYGDSIQFIRYAALLADSGAIVLVEAQDERIAPLLARAAGVSKVIVRGSEPLSSDFQIPLLSLPGIMGNLPCPPAYLEIKQEEIDFWNNLIRSEGRPKIGIAWAGRPAHENDRNRSIQPHSFEPLGQFNDALFISLQFSSAGIITEPPLLDLTASVHNFVDSAALIAGLDLVITVDSAVAHLAGALGVPVWILLPYNPDWRWLLNRDDTPWYRSVRLFRQKKPFQWHCVIDSLVEHLIIYCDQKKMLKEFPPASDM